MGTYNDDMLKGMFGTLDSRLKDIHTNLVKAQQRKLPVYVNEFNSTSNDTQLIINARSRGAIIVTAVLAFVTSAGSFTVGKHVVPLAANQPFNGQGLRWIVNVDDIRLITQTTAGSMTLELFGEEVGDVGVL